MTSTRFALLRATALATLLVGPIIGTANAAPTNYRFEIVGSSARTNAGSVITVRLIGPSDQPISNAQVFYRTLEQPNPKADFIVKRRIALSPDGQGDYRLVIREAVRSLRLEAVVPGESGPAVAMVPVRN
jgi:hypothetical protein